MQKYYELYKTLIVATVLLGIYLSSIEKIYGRKRVIRSLKVIFVLPGIFLPVYFFSSLKYLLFDEGELGSKIYSVVQLLYAFFSAFIVYSFHFNREEFVRVFELWDELFQEELFPDRRQELLRGNRKITNGWLKTFGSVSVFSAIVYSCTSFFNPNKQLEHPSGIPYRPESPDYELVATLDLIVSSFGFALLITYDSMMMALLSLEEAQFKHLKRSLSHIIDQVSVTDAGEVRITRGSVPGGEKIVNLRNSSETNEVFVETERKLKVWISHHQQVLRFHEELRKLYFYPLSVKFLVFVLIICLCSFLAVTGRLTLRDTIIVIIFCCNNYATFYVNVKFADSITGTADTLFGEAFGKSWYLFPKKIRTAFHVIAMRSQRPVQYLALRVYPLSSRSFLRIMSSAYSFFTFLLHINRIKD